MSKSQEELLREHQEQMLKLQEQMLQKQNEMVASLYGDNPEMQAMLQAQVQAATQAQMQQIDAVRQAALTAMQAGTDPAKQQAAYEQLTQLTNWKDEMQQQAAQQASASKEEGFEAALSFINSIDTELSESAPGDYVPGSEQALKMGILMSAIVGVINDHKLDGLLVEDKTEENLELVHQILSTYWGVESREDLIETLTDLLEDGGMTEQYYQYTQAKNVNELLEEFYDSDDFVSTNARFELAQYMADKVPPEMIRGWDLGRACSVARWGYFLGYLEEDELKNILLSCSQEASSLYDGWKDFGKSYLLGGLFWRIAAGEDEAAEYIENTSGAICTLLDTEEPGEWIKYPWLNSDK